MNQLQVNSATGFMESRSPHSYTFDSDKKVEFLRLAQECVDAKLAPNLRAICKAVGISMTTFWNHCDQDEEFKAQWDEIRFQLEDLLQGSLVNLGQKANGVGAAAFWLKNKVPERWSDNPGNNQQNLDFAWIKKLTEVLIDAKPKVIDAQEAITSTPKAIDASK